MRILFASLPADGHFNPLTGLAVHLRERGHDVRWYTGPTYAAKLAALGIPHYRYARALDVNGENLTERYPEYAALGNGPKAIAFAVEKVFFLNLQANLDDVLELHREFPFEAIVFDGGFYAGRLVAEKLGVRAYPIWPSPTPAPISKEAPPPFFGLRPMGGPLGRVRDRLVYALLDGSMKGGLKILADVRARVGLPPFTGHVFDLHTETSAAQFVVGVPGMDFPRTDWPANMRFVGALLPHKRGAAASSLPAHLAAKLAKHGKAIVVAQGTIDNRDASKLFVPALTALAGGEHLVVVTTGGRHTAELRARFPHDNVVIEDFVPYDALMPHAKLFVSNGGYGSVMQALVHGVPVLAAGKLEGKSDINARLSFRGLGLDLRTERPTPKQIANGVARVLADPRYRENVARLVAELAAYDPFAIMERAIVGDAASGARDPSAVSGAAVAQARAS